MKKLLLVTILTLGMLDITFAAGRGLTSREYPWVMRSVAALGMGDAYYAKSDSKYAPFYNPAGLARIEKQKIDIFPLTVGVNNNIIGFYKDYNNTDTGDTAKVADLLASKVGELEHADLSFYPSFTRKNLTVGLFAGTQVNAAPWNTIAPELNVDATADIGIVAGVAHSFLDDRLHAGVAGRFQQRYSHERSYTVQDVMAGELDDIKWTDIMDKGTGVLFDLGVIYDIPVDSPLKPRVALALNNLGLNSMGDAKSIPWSANLSAGISPGYGLLTTDIILDIRDVTRNFDQDDSWGKRINLGAELCFYKTFALRTGLHQGWMTAGLGVDLHIVKFDYAYYSEEVGAYAGQKKDSRHALEMVLGF